MYQSELLEHGGSGDNAAAAAATTTTTTTTMKYNASCTPGAERFKGVDTFSLFPGPIPMQLYFVCLGEEGTSGMPV
jgi:hypothetical protein